MLSLNDNPHAKRGPFSECERRQFFAFFAFLFSLRLRCEKPRQTDKFPIALLVHNPSALRSLCGHRKSYSIAPRGFWRRVTRFTSTIEGIPFGADGQADGFYEVAG